MRRSGVRISEAAPTKCFCQGCKFRISVNNVRTSFARRSAPEVIHGRAGVVPREGTPLFPGESRGEKGLVNAKLRVGGVYWPGTCI